MTSDRKVFLGMPGYGTLSAAAARGFWRASARPNDVHFQYSQGSLLAQNFNILWCAALNMVLRGGQCDYFAMQHADIEPCEGWLDSLIEELEANDLDMLGVVAPIKDTRGVTSIALDNDNGSTWSPKCRLTMAEIHRLPETFTAADTGHPLLLNTGLWVCRFGQDWNKKVRFTINDRIAFDRTSNQYVAQCEPEDWYFSRLCNELGLKIGCTRKIPIVHRGEMAFSNQTVWGDPIDSSYVSESPIPDWFPHDVRGWLDQSEGRKLAELAAGKRVLEIGSYCGRSTICLAQNADHVTSLDPHDGRGTPAPRETLIELCDNLARYEVSHRVSVEVGTSESWRSAQRFDLVFIDGAHDEGNVRRDYAVALSHLSEGGLIAFHDYDHIDPDVTAVVNDLLADGCELVSVTGTVAVVRPSAVPVEV